MYFPLILIHRSFLLQEKMRKFISKNVRRLLQILITSGIIKFFLPIFINNYIIPLFPFLHYPKNSFPSVQQYVILNRKKLN